MNKIGIIDDNKDQRETLQLALEAHLENRDSSLEVVDIFPFDTEDFTEYFEWIQENDICCLIFDERMHNESENNIGPVGYRGNELVTIVRNKFKDIPIYVITSNKSDEDLQEKFSEFEDIIDRQEFTDEGERYVDRFIRASQRYLDENTSELEEFQQLSELVASGKNDKKDLEKVCYPNPSVYNYSDLFAVSPINYKVSGIYASTRYMTERLYLNRPQLLYERRESFLKQREEEVSKAIEFLQEKIDDINLLKESLSGILALNKTLQKRSQIRPYKLAEIRK